MHRPVSANYFSVMGIPLRAGRVIDAGDSAASLPVAVVNQTMARQFWPGEETQSASGSRSGHRSHPIRA